MAQIVFVDTNVILDYLENRNQDVRDIVAQLLLLHKKGRVTLATSVFNVSELIDKEFEICFIGACVNERMSYDEIIRKLRGNKKLYRQIAETGKKEIEKKIKDFIFKNEIEVLSPSFNDSEQYQELYGLIYDHQLSSQDALIVLTALLSNVTYFLSNDSDLVDTISNSKSLDLYSCDLRNEVQRTNFRNSVVEAI